MSEQSATAVRSVVSEKSPIGQLRQGPGNRLVIKTTGKFCFIRLQDIDWCEAAGNYVSLHVGQHAHMVRATLQQVESYLDAAQFVRVHRSTIVNIDRIQELRPSFNGEYFILLHDKTRLTLSRGYRDTLLGKVE